MSRIRGKDTTPEMMIRSLLHKMGFRFRLHVRIPIEVGRATPCAPQVGQKNGVRGATRPTHLSTLNKNLSTQFARPDILLPKYKTAIFVHGCFWHRHRGCKNCTTPTHRREFWLTKLNGNAVRDKVHQRALRKLGWQSVVVWECESEKGTGMKRMLRRILAARSRFD